MSEQLRFDGKVVIITGAGNGLGRQHALMFAARGARVVVNDLGGGAHGGGKSSASADAVVEEIRRSGGEAVANHDSVEDGPSIVQTAIDAFGTVDIVVNNAGILRDVSFQKMSRDDWDLIMKVHVNGAFSVTHAAWPYLRDKGYGRIIFTTSGAGIYGNFGQANYSAAKLALLGLANTLTLEGRNRNILVNTIAPIAASRLTETVMPAELLAVLKPDYISPLVGWLCHEQCTETGGLFEVGAGYMAKLRWERTRGHTFGQGLKWDVEQVAAKWPKVIDFDDAEHPQSVNDTVSAIMTALNARSYGGNEFLDLDVAYAAENTLESAYDENDLALYALGVGAARNPVDGDELKYVYELDEQFAALPTYAVMPPSNVMLAMSKDGKLPLPGLNFGFDRLLHGEQYTEIRRPLPRRGRFKHTFRLKAAYDKNPHAVVVTSITTTDESGQEIAYNESTSFVRGAGGWGGDRGPSGDINQPPPRDPDFVIEEKTLPNQTLFYRLCGDWNPLHADPAFAKAFGYDRPILHGLCTYGILGRQVVKAFCGNDPRKFKSIKVRFAETVFPGETLETRMWKESELRIVCEVRVKERDKVVIRNAAVELFEQIPLPATSGAATGESATPTKGPIAADIFAAIGRYLATSKGLGDQLKTVFQFKLKSPESAWTLDMKSGDGLVVSGIKGSADVTLELNENDFVAMSTGRADPNKLYFGGKMKVSGNVMASQKLGFLQKLEAGLIDEVVQARLGQGGAPAQAIDVPSEAPKPGRAGEIFDALRKRLSRDPQAADGLQGQALRFELQAPAASWFVDFSGKTPMIEPGSCNAAQAVFGIADDDLVALATGQAGIRDLYQRGRLRVDGDVRLAYQLTMFDRLI
ncbi:peroxisomal multifunctional enzyme type 2 [Solimonas terrae]|uniref:SDR family NAD(P)-dependent oxidoreductase n=1 Tax=Solimonas terrae TaxID=1396819 RepID=A0A6M2BSI6_9GAMM|nr:peroxisomal multifunctional enzyme type 2 [Solimonas terrae]NGY05592.1 SDR family NAD(P)-dependent oxidoreductase [Solimonas terrae]